MTAKQRRWRISSDTHSTPRSKCDDRHCPTNDAMNASILNKLQSMFCQPAIEEIGRKCSTNIQEASTASTSSMHKFGSATAGGGRRVLKS
ncbi:hypothetical protein Dimus_004059, partial [Dionaea muscipula]